MEVIALIIVIGGWIFMPIIVGFLVADIRKAARPRRAWAILAGSLVIGGVPILGVIVLLGPRYMNWTDGLLLFPLAFCVAATIGSAAACVAALVARHKSHAV